MLIGIEQKMKRLSIDSVASIHVFGVNAAIIPYRTVGHDNDISLSQLFLNKILLIYDAGLLACISK